MAYIEHTSRANKMLQMTLDKLNCSEHSGKFNIVDYTTLHVRILNYYQRKVTVRYFLSDQLDLIRFNFI